MQDYDDAYIIEYARQARGCVVSNDMYRDFIGAAEVLPGTQWGTQWGTLGYSGGARCVEGDSIGAHEVGRPATS